MIQAQVNQSILAGGQRLSEARLQQTLEACSRALDVKDDPTVSIGFVSESRMRTLNKAWRGKDRVTDVLSFAFQDESVVGEVLLNYETASKQAREMKHSIADELCFLIVHGILHVFGYDHAKARDAKRMLPLQEKILRSLQIDPRL